MKTVKSFLIYSLFVLITLIWFFKPTHAPFKQIDSYSEIQHVFDSCDKNTLITFDVDDTLITSPDILARSFEYSAWFKICMAFKYPALIFNQETYDWFASIVLQEAQRFVFDPDIVQIIKKLQEQGCNIVALTSMESGSLGVIKNMPEWRANMLKSFGIDLRGAFRDTSFTTLPKYRGNYPCLFKGILCANQVAKGKVLGAFLDHFHLKPSQIISFDDEKSALDSIASECAKRNIPYFGYQCTGVKKLPGVWNTKRALLQLDSVVQHARWLSDVEADTTLAAQTRSVSNLGAAST